MTLKGPPIRVCERPTMNRRKPRILRPRLRAYPSDWLYMFTAGFLTGIFVLVIILSMAGVL